MKVITITSDAQAIAMFFMRKIKEMGISSLTCYSILGRTVFGN